MRSVVHGMALMAMEMELPLSNSGMYESSNPGPGSQVLFSPSSQTPSASSASASEASSLAERLGTYASLVELDGNGSSSGLAGDVYGGAYSNAALAAAFGPGGVPSNLFGTAIGSTVDSCLFPLTGLHTMSIFFDSVPSSFFLLLIVRFARFLKRLDDT